MIDINSMGSLDFDLTSSTFSNKKKREISILWESFENKGGTEPRFFSSGKKKDKEKQAMSILWESFLIFMVFIFYKQERYGRRAAAPPPRKKAEGLR